MKRVAERQVRRLAVWLAVFAVLPLQALAQDFNLPGGGSHKSDGFDPDDVDPETADAIHGFAQDVGLRYAIFAGVVVIFVVGSKLWLRHLRKKNKDLDKD